MNQTWNDVSSDPFAWGDGYDIHSSARLLREISVFLPASSRGRRKQIAQFFYADIKNDLLASIGTDKARFPPLGQASAHDYLCAFQVLARLRLKRFFGTETRKYIRHLVDLDRGYDSVFALYEEFHLSPASAIRSFTKSLNKSDLVLLQQMLKNEDLSSAEIQRSKKLKTKLISALLYGFQEQI